MTRPSGSEVLVGRELGLPRLRRRLVDRVEPVRRGLVGTEQPEVARCRRSARNDVAEKRAEHARRFRQRLAAAPRPRPRSRGSRGGEVAQQPPAVGVRVRAHPPVARGQPVDDLGLRRARRRRTARRDGTSASMSRAARDVRGCPALSASGTWCARHVPSTGRPSTSFGPVQPFGVRSTIIGHAAACDPPAPARVLDRRGSRVEHMVEGRRELLVHDARVVARDEIGLPPAAGEELRRAPARGSAPSTVGFAILYPFRCRIGSTAPSPAGSRNLFECQLVASGPVSASPSPTTHATTRSGLSNAAPNAWLNE